MIGKEEGDFALPGRSKHFSPPQTPHLAAQHAVPSGLGIPVAHTGSGAGRPVCALGAKRKERREKEGGRSQRKYDEGEREREGERKLTSRVCESLLRILGLRQCAPQCAHLLTHTPAL